MTFSDDVMVIKYLRVARNIVSERLTILDQSNKMLIT
jgi:hypothetical protein